MSFRGVTNAFALALGLGVACGSPAETVGVSRAAIQGGAADTTHNFAVGLCGGAGGGPMSGEGCVVFCSGALIAPNLVLTARHCFDQVEDATVNCATDTFGPALYRASDYYVTTDPDMFDEAASWYPVTQVIAPSSEAFCGNDIALAILGVSVPSSAAPTLATPEIWFPVDAPQFSASETAIGYGADAPGDSSSAGRRRILEGIPLACIGGDADHDKACAPAKSSGVAAAEFEAGDGPCEGDSGSSAYEQSNFSRGTFLSLGVLSRGGASAGTCQGSIYTQLYPWRSLIVGAAAQAAALGGYPAPAWTRPAAGADAGHDAAAGSGGGGSAGGCSEGGAAVPAPGAYVLALAAAAGARRRRRPRGAARSA